MEERHLAGGNLNGQSLDGWSLTGENLDRESLEGGTPSTSVCNILARRGELGEVGEPKSF